MPDLCGKSFKYPSATARVALVSKLLMLLVLSTYMVDVVVVVVIGVVFVVVMMVAIEDHNRLLCSHIGRGCSCSDCIWGIY